MEEIRIAAIIPTYNNERTVLDVIEKVHHYIETIIVVNDGSTDSTGLLLKECPHIQLLTIPQNRGKGVALKDGMSAALARGFTHAITVDADGQHLAEDIPAFIANIRHHPIPYGLATAQYLLSRGLRSLPGHALDDHSARSGTVTIPA